MVLIHHGSHGVRRMLVVMWMRRWRQTMVEYTIGRRISVARAMVHGMWRRWCPRRRQLSAVGLS